MLELQAEECSQKHQRKHYKKQAHALSPKKFFQLNAFSITKNPPEKYQEGINNHFNAENFRLLFLEEQILLPRVISFRQNYTFRNVRLNINVLV